MPLPPPNIVDEISSIYLSKRDPHWRSITHTLLSSLYKQAGYETDEEARKKSWSLIKKEAGPNKIVKQWVKFALDLVDFSKQGSLLFFLSCHMLKSIILHYLTKENDEVHKEFNNEINELKEELCKHINKIKDYRDIKQDDSNEKKLRNACILKLAFLNVIPEGNVMQDFILTLLPDAICQYKNFQPTNQPNIFKPANIMNYIEIDKHEEFLKDYIPDMQDRSLPIILQRNLHDLIYQKEFQPIKLISLDEYLNNSSVASKANLSQPKIEDETVALNETINTEEKTVPVTKIHHNEEQTSATPETTNNKQTPAYNEEQTSATPETTNSKQTPSYEETTRPKSPRHKNGR